MKLNITLIYLLFCPFGLYIYGQQQTMMTNNSHNEHHSHLSFVENKGQWEDVVKFKSEIRGGALFFETNAVTYNFFDPEYLEKIRAIKSGADIKLDPFVTFYAYRMNFLGSNNKPVIEGNKPLETYHNYYIGSDPKKWASGVKVYQQIRYKQLYDGIDLLFYEQHHTYKYEFVISPKANPSLIRMSYEGADTIFIKKKNLYIKTGKLETIERAPFAYQILDNGTTQKIECSFVIDGETVSFKFGKYDVNKQLIIDPALIFASFSGSPADNWGYTATYDNSGNLYGAGTIYGTGYPSAYGTFKGGPYGSVSLCNIAITKFSANGTAAIYATYLGGSGSDAPHSLIVNNNNELYVLASTSSPNYPTSQTAYGKSFNYSTISVYPVTRVNAYPNGSNVAISKFNAAGTQLLASTFFGGSGNDGLNTELAKHYAEEIRGEIQLDKSGNVYIVSSTSSKDLPVDTNSFQPVHGGGVQDGFIAKFMPNLDSLIWCSYFGGTSEDAIYSMKLDDNNNIYICGGTKSPDFFTTPAVIKPTNTAGNWDGFIAKISNDGTTILAGTFYGTSGYDQAYLITTDNENNVVVFGQSEQSGNYYYGNSPAPWSYGYGQYISTIRNSLDSIIWSTHFGNSTQGPNMSPTALMVDLCDNIHVAGWCSNIMDGTTGNFTANGMPPPPPNAIQPNPGDPAGNDFYFLSINGRTRDFQYATYYGGSGGSGEHVDGGTNRFDEKGQVYMAVCAACSRGSFPVSPNAVYKTRNSNNCNLGVIKLNLDIPLVKALFVHDVEAPDKVCLGMGANFNSNNSDVNDPAKAKYRWHFGDGGTDTVKNPTHVYNALGTYRVWLVIVDSTSCNITDSVYHDIQVMINTTKVLPTVDVCKGSTVQIGESPSSNTNTTYTWYPSAGLSNPNISNPDFIDTNSRSYMMLVNSNVCIDTVYQSVNVIDVPKSGKVDITRCLGENLNYARDFVPMSSYHWSSNPYFSDMLNTSTNDPYLNVVLTQDPSIYYLKRTKQICTVYDTLSVNASSFDLTFDNQPKICKGDTVRLAVNINNSNHCSRFNYVWNPYVDIVGSSLIYNPAVAPQSPMYFSVEVTNEHNCKRKDSIFIDVIVLKPDITQKDITCFNAHDGIISINMSGGDKPYLFQWGHTATDTSYLKNLYKGTYSIRITDSNKCRIDTSILITEPTKLVVGLQNVIDSVFCDGICSGQALGIASGGIPPYIFAWITKDSTDFIDNLCAGDYELMLIDKNGCKDSVTLKVKDTSDMKATYISEDASCFGKCDGNVQIIVSDGISPYIYIWKRGDRTDFVDSLCADVYDVSITDEQMCTRRIFPKVFSPPPISLDSVYIVHPYCHGMKDGLIHIYAAGGTSPYTYFWDGIQGTDSLTGLEKAGEYPLRIIDSKSCVMDTVFILLDYDTLSINHKTMNALCSGVCNGTITVEVLGGVSPYTYLWFDETTNSYITDLCAGKYELTAYDSNKCIVKVVIPLILDSAYFPSDIRVWSDMSSIYRGQSTVIYGSDYGSKFNYEWSPPDFLTNTKGTKTTSKPIDNIMYTYTVYDKNGCVGMDSILITVMDVICGEPLIFVPTAFSPNGDGVNDILYVRGNVLEQLEFAIYDRLGEKIFETKDKSIGWDGKFRGEQCAPGVYVYYLDATCIGGERYLHKGNVTLVR